MSKTPSQPKPVYAIYGQDRFRRREALTQLLARLQDTGDGLGPTRLSGSDVELAEVLDAVRTYALLGGRQVAVVDDADPLITRHRAALEAYCRAPSESGTLILVCDTLPANTRLHKQIAECGEVIRCDPIKGRAVISWISDRANKLYGKRMDVRSAQLLRELIGDDLGQLDGELSKLTIYVSDRPVISAQDVSALVGHHRQESVFAVTDAIAAGDPATALKHWERVLATDRAAPGRAIGGLAWAIRRTLDLKQRFDAGENINTLARQAFTDPATLTRRLRAVTTEQLQRQLCDLMQADLDSKSGVSMVAVAIEKFVVTHTRSSRMRRTA